jgi:spermidine synthase
MEKKLMVGVFGTGAAIMVLELLGTRIVAPYVGASLYVWTSMIGVILGCMAAGYYLGGEWASRKASMDLLGLIVGLTAIWVLLLALFKDLILGVVIFFAPGGYGQSVMSALALFGPPAILLGLVSPMSAQILIKKAEASGEWVGRLYAVSTLGSIVGTFMTGFWLVPTFGHLRILYLVAFVLSLIAWWWTENRKLWQIGLIIFCLFGIFRLWSIKTISKNILVDKDTAYSRVMVYADNDGGRSMWIDKANSSKVYLNNPTKLGFGYYPYYDLMFWNGRGEKNVLMIGGAGLGYPRYLVKKYPEVKITVVEIDKGLYELAKQYLGYEDDKNISLVFQDGRLFLNNNDEKYDAILLDVFSSYTVPPHMVTREAIYRMKENLKPDGIVIMNMIGAVSGDNGHLARNIRQGFLEQFAAVHVYGVATANTKALQNLALVATNGELNLKNLNVGEKELLKNPMSFEKGVAFSDDWSPTDFYSAMSMLNPR